MHRAGMTGRDLERHDPPPLLMSHSMWWWSAYLLIALVASRPLCCSLGSAIPVGCESEATVPLLNLWTIWWNADRAAVSFRGYWDAPIFYPTQGTFAFSEAQPSTLVVAPVIGLTGNRALAYNVYLILILSLNGWTCHRLLRRVGHRTWLACCGGAMCEMLPFVWWQLGVLQLTTLFGVIWTIHSVLDLFEPRGRMESGATLDDLICSFRAIGNFVRRGRSFGRVDSAKETEQRGVRVTTGSGSIFRCIPVSLRLGCAFALTYWMCNYWGLFLAILLIPSSLCLLNGRLLQRAFWLDFIAAALVVGGLVGPIAYVQKSLSSRHAWNRTPELIRDLSAHPHYYLDLPFTEIKPGRKVGNEETGQTETPLADGRHFVEWSTLSRKVFPADEHRSLWTLGVGGIRLLLVPIGLFAAILTRGRRRWGLFVATFGLVAFGLSLGPTLCVAQFVPWLGGVSIYEVLQRWIPGFALIRSPFRFAVFVHLAVVWMSVEALDLLDPRRWRRRNAGESAAQPTPESTLKIESGDEATISLIDGSLPESSGARSTIPSGAALRQTSPRTVVELLRWTPLVLFSLIVTLEVWPAPQRLHRCPPPAEVPVWVMWLRENTYSDDVIVCLPFPTGYAVDYYEPTAEWMYWATFHRRRLVNGYSGFFPEPFVSLKEDLNKFYRPPGGEAAEPELRMYPADNAGLKKLNDCGAKYVVLKRSFATRDDVWQHPLTKFRWAWVTGDEKQQLDVYQIEPPLSE